MNRLPGIAAVLAAGTVVAHALPALAALPPLRTRISPALTGIGRSGHVALTFDDGPHPTATPMVLRLLDRHQVTATFFLLGSMARAHPQIGRDIVAAGHEVGLHGDTHTCHLMRGPAAVHDDLTRGYDALAELTGTPPRWFRPPYGVLTAGTLLAAHRRGLRPVLWSAWGRDWTAHATPESVYRTVLKGTVSGGTILLHDSDVTAAPGSWRSTLAALPRLLDTLARRRLTVGALRDHGILAPGGTVVEGVFPRR